MISIKQLIPHHPIWAEKNVQNFGVDILKWNFFFVIQVPLVHIPGDPIDNIREELVIMTWQANT